jgi:hypothetical protein
MLQKLKNVGKCYSGMFAVLYATSTEMITAADFFFHMRLLMHRIMTQTPNLLFCYVETLQLTISTHIF